MDLFDHLQINFYEIDTYLIHLNKYEWISMLKQFLKRLLEIPTGNVLLTKINEYLCEGYKITITNRDILTSYIYPKIKYLSKREILIVFPNVPYFIETQVINKDFWNLEKIVNKINPDLTNILNYNPIDSVIKDYHLSITDSLTRQNPYKYERMSSLVCFAHELIHCLRHFNNFDMSSEIEEESTIYGITYNLLKYNKIIITENQIRKELGMTPRVSHDSRNIFCYLSTNTYVNANKFSKEDFFI